MRITLSLFVAAVCLAQGSSSPCVASLEAPDYPELAIQARLEGSVSVEVVIGNGGGVESASAVGGHALLREEAEKNARKWRFKSRSDCCNTGNFTLTYKFALEGEEVTYRARPRVVFSLPSVVHIVAHPRAPQP